MRGLSLVRSPAYICQSIDQQDSPASINANLRLPVMPIPQSANWPVPASFNAANRRLTGIRYNRIVLSRRKYNRRKYMKLVERVVEKREYEAKIYGELRDHPINLDEIFDIVVNTIHFQYAGYPHKRQYYTPSEYHTYVFTHYRYQTLTYEMLVRSLHQFVADMHDRHLTFTCDDWIDYRNLAMRYRVRATKDVLYVTQADPETGLVPGDKILKVNNQTPPGVRKLTRGNCFYSNDPERELWGGYLRMATSLQVEHADGTQERLEMKPCPAAQYTRPIEEEYPISCTLLPAKQKVEVLQTEEKRIVLLQVQRMDESVLSELITAHRQDIEESDTLILDLRRCIGGDEGALWELFPYITDKEITLRELLADEGSYCLCTKENCSLRISQLKAYRETILPGNEMEGDASQETQLPATGNAESSSVLAQQLSILDEEIAFYRENMGKGLVFRAPDPIEDEKITPAAKSPARVIILTDTFCENEGEQFVAMCRRCGSKVTLIGRPTMGSLDYFDPIPLQVHTHMVLSYPIRMTKAAYEGRGISEKGIPVDIYIPWTPEEITKDVILEQALEL